MLNCFDIQYPLFLNLLIVPLLWMVISYIVYSYKKIPIKSLLLDVFVTEHVMAPDDPVSCRLKRDGVGQE